MNDRILPVDQITKVSRRVDQGLVKFSVAQRDLRRRASGNPEPVAPIMKAPAQSTADEAAATQDQYILQGR